MADQTPVSLVALAARTTTGNGNSIAVPVNSQRLAVLAEFTAVSGTSPSCTLSVEWSVDGINFAAADPADAFTAVTAVSNKVKEFAVKGNRCRIVWTISGTTPSFTFRVTGLGA